MKLKRKEKKSAIYENYSECWNYLKESRYYIYFVIGLFILFILIGFFYPHFFEEQIKNLIKDILKKTVDLKGLSLITYIFQNNIVVSLVGIFSGIFFGIIPFLITLTNGYVLGFVSNIVSAQEGYYVLLKLIPHGIFEIPAVIISMALGIRLGLSILKKDPIKALKRNFILVLKILIFIIIPFLIIAAIIEGGLITLFS